MWIIASGRGKIAELIGTAKRLPKDYRDGKQRVDDPVAAAKEVKDVTPSLGPSKDSEPRS